jgi:hypothetical protein
MGMTVTVYAVSSGDLARIIAKPKLVLELFSSQPGSIAAQSLPREACDIDKAWAAIHFVLTGLNMEQGGQPHHDFLLFAGTEIGDIDVGYGPARAIEPRDVANISAALEPFTRPAFGARFEHKKLLAEDVYGVGPDESEELEYVCDHFGSLRTFISAAARNGLIIAMT